MPFSISEEAKEYYFKLNKKSKTGRFQTQFDFYYLCLLVGFKKEFIGKNIGSKFVDEFPKEFRIQRDQIIGLLISTEINRRGIDISNKQEVEKIILNLVRSDSPTRLSETGENLINQYSKGGFNKIAEKIPLSSIFNLDSFLVQFYNLIN